ncbi:LptF/LptG family permease [Aridibaculum aurantiacum]|uniref:LptF/LptG family permease n=1 Tax=Aridibaculum aurantiacum TaxID=2810307 RepID=UPI001A9608ED|nr:LptF/LptG family permease [Aridibaculum aurantiacum]
MKKIDWYIFKNLLVTFVFSILLFTFITVVVDISEKADDFVRSKLSAMEIIRQYYIGFVPHILALLFPLFVFIAVIYFTSKMAGRSEVVAILASGTSFNRYLRPFFLAGCLLAVVLWFGNRTFIPMANDIRVSFQARYVDMNSSYNSLFGQRTAIYLQVDPVRYVGMSYDTTSKTGGNFFLQHVRGNKIDYNLRAESISWDTAAKKWLLENVIERKIKGIEETVTMIPSMHVDINLTPKDLKRDQYVKDKLTTPELDRFIKLEEKRGVEGLNALIVERYRRDATPAAVILLTLIGAVVASRKVRGGSGSHLAVGFITCALFILADRFSTIFSTKGNLHPMLAAWTPNIIFFFVAVWFYRKAPK